MHPLLTFDQVSFGYQRDPLLHEISLQIHPGEFLGVLGANGCGKTTLLRLMAGVLKPQVGCIQLLDRPIDSFPSRARARQIAMVPQDLEILFPYRALEIVLMGRWPYLKPFSFESAKDLKEAQEAMEATDCLHLAERSTTELSGGEKERVMIARALAQGSKILLLDEPTTHLDLKHQIQIYALLKKLNQEMGYTIVLVSHDLNFAAMTCKKILLLHEGKIAACGRPEEVIRPETLQQVFGAPVWVEKQSHTGQPFFIPKLDDSTPPLDEHT